MVFVVALVRGGRGRGRRWWWRRDLATVVVAALAVVIVGGRRDGGAVARTGWRLVGDARHPLAGRLAGRGRVRRRRRGVACRGRVVDRNGHRERGRRGARRPVVGCGRRGGRHRAVGRRGLVTRAHHRTRGGDSGDRDRGHHGHGQ